MPVRSVVLAEEGGLQELFRGWASELILLNHKADEMFALDRDVFMPLSIFIVDGNQWVFVGSRFAQNLECHLAKSPDIRALVVRLTVHDLRGEKARTNQCDLLSDMEVFGYMNA